MNALRLMQLLKNNTMIQEARHASFRIQHVLSACLQPAEEDVIVITDNGSPEHMIAPVLGAGYFLAARSLGLESTLLTQQQKLKGELTEPHIEAALDESGYENIIILVTHSMGSTQSIGKSFRKFSRTRRHKFISCPGLASLPTRRLSDVLKAIDTDYHTIRTSARLFEQTLRGGKELHITTPAGTDLWLTMRRNTITPNDGHYTFPGNGGNLPAGEVYLAPRKKKVEGRVVIDGSSRSIWGTTLIKEPVVMEVRNGEVVEISGGREARMLEKSIEWAHETSKHPWGVRRLSEFGIGLNPNARIMGAMIIDEKTQNTVHVAIGSNHWFGGTVYAKIHLDQVMRNPVVEVDGEALDIGIASFKR